VKKGKYMGLIDFFKKMFNKKVISLPAKRRDVLIQPHSTGYTTIKLGQKLVVDNGWAAVIVVKDEVTDVFMEGTHEVSLGYIPKTTKLLKLDRGKVEKKGMLADVVLPQSFRCDLYFVRMDYIQGRKWESDLIKVRERDKKNLKYKMNGNYSFQVQAPDKVVDLFLIDWGKIKTGKAILKLDALLSDVCTETLWNKKFKSRDELTQYDFGNLVLKPAVYKNFIKYGICVIDMQVEKIIYPESVAGEKYVEVTPDTEQQKQLEQTTATEGKINNINQLETQIDYKMESGKLLDQVKHIEEEETPENKKIPFYNFNDSNKQNLNYKTQKTLKYHQDVEMSSMTCPYCKATLPLGSKFCNKCGKLIIEDKKDKAEDEGKIG